MDTSNLDIVYFIKDSAYNDELKYSLRSVEKNFPHRRVIFYGGRPCELIPDKQVLVKQEGGTKWDRVRKMYEMAGQDNELSKNFVLFNDDFFVLHPIEKLPLYYWGQLIDLIYHIEIKNNCRPTPYTQSLKRTLKTLREHFNQRFVFENNFELHVPFVFNKSKLSTILNEFPEAKGTRSLYGNSTFLCTEEMLGDVKITDLESLPEATWDYCSTEDTSFREGKVGIYLRELFPKKSRFER